MILDGARCDVTLDPMQAMLTWFDPKTGPEARERAAKILADVKQTQNASTIGFLFNVFPMDLAPPDVINEKLIDQFYLLGPVGERFFHWMFLLGAADNVIGWEYPVFVKNFREDVTDEQFQAAFAVCGKITSAVVARENGKSKRHGFVNFETPESAVKCIEQFNDSVKLAVDGEKIYVVHHHKKATSLKKIEKPKQGVDGKASENAAVEVQKVEDVPFWRALEEVRQTLIKHLKTPDALAKSGLYFDSKDKSKDAKPAQGVDGKASENAAVEVTAALNGSASEIFTIPEIYQEAKDLKDFKNDETCIRGQLEFEWLITRPYSRRWANHSKPPNQDKSDEEPPNQDKSDEEQSSESSGDRKQTDSGPTCSCFSSCLKQACSCFSSSSPDNSGSHLTDIRDLTKTRKMSTVEIELHSPMNGGAAASSPRSRRSHSSVLNSTSILDDHLKDSLNNNDWEWNESVWESVVSAVGNKKGHPPPPRKKQRNQTSSTAK